MYFTFDEPKREMGMKNCKTGRKLAREEAARQNTRLGHCWCSAGWTKYISLRKVLTQKAGQ